MASLVSHLQPGVTAAKALQKVPRTATQGLDTSAVCLSSNDSALSIQSTTKKAKGKVFHVIDSEDCWHYSFERSTFLGPFSNGVMG